MTNRQFALVGGAPWRMALGRSSADCRHRSNCSPHSSAFLLSSRNLYWLKTSSMVRWMVLRSVGEAGPRELQLEAECPRVVKLRALPSCHRSGTRSHTAPESGSSCSESLHCCRGIDSPSGRWCRVRLVVFPSQRSYLSLP